MKVAIIGCGLIGRKRAHALEPGDSLIACCDIEKSLADKFSEDYKCKAYYSAEDLIKNEHPEIVVVAVINKYVLPITISAIESGSYVLAEKPLGRNAMEAREMVRVSQLHEKPIKTGFNHRFHPGIMKAKAYLEEGKIGNLLFIRGRYGHGSRPGMEKEWRSSKDLCGGGELLDQGVHLIDLSRWFAGDIKSAFGKAKTKFWPIEVEDNAFILLESESGIDMQLQVSWTNWKNIFSMELFGSNGYLRIEGLGGSYGPETLELGLRKPEGGKPDIEFFQFPPEDISWNMEWAEFKQAIHEKRQPIGNGNDGLKANEIIEAVYRSSTTKQIQLL